MRKAVRALAGVTVLAFLFAGSTTLAASRNSRPGLTVSVLTRFVAWVSGRLSPPIGLPRSEGRLAPPIPAPTPPPAPESEEESRLWPPIPVNTTT